MAMKPTAHSGEEGDAIVVGQVWTRNGKTWGVCACGRLVRIDKPILGSWHFHSPEWRP